MCDATIQKAFYLDEPCKILSVLPTGESVIELESFVCVDTGSYMEPPAYEQTRRVLIVSSDLVTKSASGLATKLQEHLDSLKEISDKKTSEVMQLRETAAQITKEIAALRTNMETFENIQQLLDFMSGKFEYVLMMYGYHKYEIVPKQALIKSGQAMVARQFANRNNKLLFYVSYDTDGSTTFEEAFPFQCEADAIDCLFKQLKEMQVEDIGYQEIAAYEKHKRQFPMRLTAFELTLEQRVNNAKQHRLDEISKLELRLKQLYDDESGVTPLPVPAKQ